MPNRWSIAFCIPEVGSGIRYLCAAAAKVTSMLQGHLYHMANELLFGQLKSRLDQVLPARNTQTGRMDKILA